MSKNSSILKNNWLVLLIAIQPVLDVIAYFTRSESGTISGYIRLVIMLALPVAVLVKTGNKKGFIAVFSVIGLYCLLHVANGFRVGYMNPISDVKYIMQVIQAPVIALSLIFAMKNDADRNQATRGMIIGAVIYVAFLAIAVLTGTSNSTYGTGVGVSGWVIDANRCANSIILIGFSVFMMYRALESQKPWEKILLPLLVAVLLLTNGTKSCYISCLGLMLSYCGYCIIEAVICRRKFRLTTAVVTVVLLISSVLVYPYTPRAVQDAIDNAAGTKNEDKFVLEMRALGYELSEMTLEEKINDPFVFKKFETYYYEMIWNGVPELLDEFGLERVMRAYNATTSAAKLIDTRANKRQYSRFVFEDSDAITKLVGFEYQNIGKNATHLDLENDWTAIFYYYGYIGFALYAGFALYFVFLVIKRLLKDFKRSLIPLNFSLLVCFVLQVFLAEFSGALLRRPNSAIFFAVVLALLYYQTVKATMPEESAA